MGGAGGRRFVHRPLVLSPGLGLAKHGQKDPHALALAPEALRNSHGAIEMSPPEPSPASSSSETSCLETLLCYLSFQPQEP